MNFLKLLKAKSHQPCNLVTVSGDVADIYIYDVISADWGVSAMSVIGALAEAKDAKEIKVHINSGGGDVFEANAIIAAIQAIQASKAKVTAEIEGLCASAATSIALACDTVRMAQGSLFMIHNSSTFGYGDYRDFEKTAQLLQKVDASIVARYVEKTGKSAEEIQQMMDAETWFTTAEAIENGFVDSAIEKEVKNSWDLSAYANAPKSHQPQPAPTNTAAQRMQQNANRLRLIRNL